MKWWRWLVGLFQWHRYKLPVNQLPKIENFDPETGVPNTMECSGCGGSLLRRELGARGFPEICTVCDRNKVDKKGRAVR